MAKEIIGHRFIRHRQTGLPAGPPTPVFKDDWPYRIPPPSQIVWRYLDLWKFEDMCRTATLYFCRCDKFPDPLEGRLSKRGIHGTSASDREFAAAYPTPQDHDTQASAQEITRGCMFVNCWHMNTRESGQMWREYTSSTDSVVITSSVKALGRAISAREVIVSAVRYVPEDRPRTEFNHTSMFFFKDSSFRYERELRLLRPLREGEEILEDRDEDSRRLIPVNLRLLVHRVVLNKRISNSSRKHVTELVHRHCRRAVVEDSSR